MRPARELKPKRRDSRAHDSRLCSYATLGHGHDEAFRRAFCRALRRVGYKDVLSIEHEDAVMDRSRRSRESPAQPRDVGQPV